MNIIPFVNLISAGYLLESMKNGIAKESTLPGWDNIGRKFTLGLSWFLVNLVYLLIPALIVVLAKPSSTTLAIVFIVGLFCGLMIPMALANFMAQGKISAAFDFAEISKRIGRVANMYSATYLAMILIGLTIGALLTLIPVLGIFLNLFFIFFWALAFYNYFGFLYSVASKGEDNA